MRAQLNRTAHSFWAAHCLVLAALCGCSATPVDGNAQACEQSGEFGNHGCVVVEGRVVGARGQPLAGVSVGPRSSADGGQFNGMYNDSDADGRFSFRIQRFALPDTPSDSVSLWIGASVYPVAPAVTSTIVDSALVRVAVTPIGAVPIPVSVTVTLPVE